jgi:hypothetical protein
VYPPDRAPLDQTIVEILEQERWLDSCPPG